MWDGAWVSEHLGVSVDGDGLSDLVGLALRRNPRRAHLLVSHVLGKHIPVDPRRLQAAAAALAAQVRRRAAGPYAVLGYAETATGLGHAVAAALGSDSYLHSTRRPVSGVAPLGDFEEEHSHATSHLLLPERPDLLRAPVLVLVDDELSTGRTIANTVRALPRAAGYVAAALVDVRPDPVDDLAVACVGRGTVHLPPDLAARAATAIERYAGAPHAGAPRGKVVKLPPAWPAHVREGGRHGFGREDEASARLAASRVAGQLAEEPLGQRLLVLGTEELMHAPALIAAALAETGGRAVHVSSTTRSPVAAIDEPGYAIRTVLRFPAFDDPADGPGPRYAYNVAPARGAEPYSDVLLVVDDAGDTAALWASGGLVETLAAVCERVFVAVLPSHRPAPA